MKRLVLSIITLIGTLPLLAQGWPSEYQGVMLQGFYWDSFSQSQWVKLERQADELSQYFKLVWIPQSADCGGTSMGYDDLYWFPGHYNSSFGTEAELRSLISTFSQKGIGTIGDVVINHRRNVSNWVDFPKETYQGVTYQLMSTDICKDDDGGAAYTWATQNGYQLSSNNDTGEGWDGMRDLDHKSENVQKNVKAYLNMLLNDMGYIGFRYDMVKGYSGSYTKLYNEYAKPQFSVGECWDNTNTIKSWIDATSKTSAAFDFQFKYVVRNAVDNNNWTYLGKQNDNSWPLVSSNFNSGSYRRYAVTFVENHDTEVRPDGSSNGPLRKDTLAANAFLLAMPGTPCVFLKHWIAYKSDIKAMIDVRNAVGIHNESSYINAASQTGYYAVLTTGSKDQMMAVVGKNASSYEPNANFVKVLSGYHYAYYMKKSMETAWVDLPSGEYDNAQQATLTAVSTNNGAQLVYTTDGSDPKATSTKVASGTKITIDGDMTLKVGLLIGSTVSGIVTRTYSKPVPVQPTTITVYVNTDNVGWTSVNYWTWGGDDTHAPNNSQWPGDKITAKTTIKGKQWYYKQFTINGDDDFVNFVFSTGTGSPQTVDVNNITTDKFFEISANKNSDGKHLVDDVTGSYAGIESVFATDDSQPGKIYNLSGQQVERPTKGIYIINHKKVVIR
jgi:alpha-amylase